MFHSDQRILKRIVKMAEDDLGIELTPTGVVEEDVDQGLTWYQLSTRQPNTPILWIRADGGHYVIVDEAEYAVDDETLEQEPHEPTIDWSEHASPSNSWPSRQPNKDRCSRCGKPHTDEDPLYWHDEAPRYGYYHWDCINQVIAEDMRRQVEVEPLTIENILTWELMFSIHTDGYGQVAVVSAPGDEYVVVGVGPDDEQFLSKVQAAMRGLLGN